MTAEPNLWQLSAVPCRLGKITMFYSKGKGDSYVEVDTLIPDCDCLRSIDDIESAYFMVPAFRRSPFLYYESLFVNNNSKSNWGYAL